MTTLESNKGEFQISLGCVPTATDLLGQPFKPLDELSSWEDQNLMIGSNNQGVPDSCARNVLYYQYAHTNDQKVIAGNDYGFKISGVDSIRYEHNFITPQRTFEPASTPKALVSLQPPHTIYMVDDELMRRFKLQHIGERVIGQTVEIFPGSFWSELLALAADGRTVGERYASSVCSQYDTDLIVCTPVVEASNGSIHNILVELVKPSNESHFSDSPVLRSNSSIRDWGKASRSFSIRDNAQILPNACAHIPDGQQPNTIATHAIIRRQRSRDRIQRDEDTPQTDKTVVLTHDLLRALRGQPLPLAARAVGVSVTAFKRACRRLGVGRWEHKRGPARAPRKAAASKTQGGGPTRRRGNAPQREHRGEDTERSDSDHGPAADGPAADGRQPGPSESAQELWERLFFGGPGAEGEGADSDDALVLELLARPWPA